MHQKGQGLVFKLTMLSTHDDTITTCNAICVIETIKVLKNISTFRNLWDQYVFCVYLVKINDKVIQFFQFLWFIDLHYILA